MQECPAYLTWLNLDDIISYAFCGCLVYVSVSIGWQFLCDRLVL